MTDLSHYEQRVKDAISNLERFNLEHGDEIMTLYDVGLVSDSDKLLFAEWEVLIEALRHAHEDLAIERYRAAQDEMQADFERTIRTTSHSRFSGN